MSNMPSRRKVLIIEDQSAIRNILYVLLAGLGCDWDMAYSGQLALAKIREQNYDAVLLDLRCAEIPAGEVMSQIKDIRPSMVGRVLVITGEVTDPQTLERIERSAVPHIHYNELAKGLWAALKELFGLAKVSQAVSGQPSSRTRTAIPRLTPTSRIAV